jgi:hypothetical protein
MASFNSKLELLQAKINRQLAKVVERARIREAQISIVIEQVAQDGSSMNPLKDLLLSLRMMLAFLIIFWILTWHSHMIDVLHIIDLVLLNFQAMIASTDGSNSVKWLHRYQSYFEMHRVADTMSTQLATIQFNVVLVNGMMNFWSITIHPIG